MHLSLTADGRDATTTGLYEWLRADPMLRGRTRLQSGPIQPGTMGGAAEVMVQATAAVVGGGALWAALASSITAWLSQRRSDVTITVTGTDGRQVSIDAKRVDDPQAVIRQVLDAALTPPVP